ncbi:hypothetical protein J6590_020239 [Homalodisca vitripennis]|nr:hypothetical protein J6590_020239 [Homalodisca vitripennis]
MKLSRENALTEEKYNSATRSWPAQFPQILNQCKSLTRLDLEVSVGYRVLTKEELGHIINTVLRLAAAKIPRHYCRRDGELH